MSEELNKTGELLDGIAANPPEPMSVQPAGQADAVQVDSKGVEFNPVIHQVDENGIPKRGSVNQFLLRKEAKKSAFRRAADKISEIWHGEKPENAEVPEVREIPLSDHEIQEIPKEKHETEDAGQPERGGKAGFVTESAENSADLFFVGGSMLFGIEFLNQRQKFHPKTAEVIAEYERRTGKSLDLPPGVALTLGLGRIGYEIIQREPACKVKFESGLRVIRDNAGRYIRSKIPVLNKIQGENFGGENEA